MASATSPLPVPTSPTISAGRGLFETWSICAYTRCISLERPMMLSGWKRSLSSNVKRSFSAFRSSFSSRASRRSFTAAASICAIISSRRSFSGSSSSTGFCTSALKAPITWCSIITGTQRKALSSVLPRPVRSKKSGSFATEGMIMGLPVSTTRPVMPSPTL